MSMDGDNRQWPRCLDCGGMYFSKTASPSGLCRTCLSEDEDFARGFAAPRFLERPEDRARYDAYSAALYDQKRSHEEAQVIANLQRVPMGCVAGCISEV